MIRTRCQDCGSWHGGELEFCPSCGVMGQGLLQSPAPIAVYQRGWTGLWHDLAGSLLGRGVLRTLDWLGTLVGRSFWLFVQGGGWVPVHHTDRVSFVMIGVEEIYGFDLPRLQKIDRRLGLLGYDPVVDFTIPEEHQPRFYRLYQRPGEQTWALMTAAAPAQLQGGRWQLTFHSRLKSGKELVSRPFSMTGPESGGKFLFLSGPQLPEMLNGLHRQEVFRNHGARLGLGDGDAGLFLQHYQQLRQALLRFELDQGRLKRGRGPSAPRSPLRSSWSTAVGSCAHCWAPVDAEQAVKVGAGLLCGDCCPDAPEMAAPRHPSGWERLLLRILALLLGGMVALLLSAGRPELAVLLWPMPSGLAAALLRRFRGWRLVDRAGSKAGMFAALCREALWWSCWPVAFWPCLWGKPGWHEFAAGAYVAVRR